MKLKQTRFAGVCRGALLLAMAATISVEVKSQSAAESTEKPQLPTFSHKYVWVSFSLSVERPFSPNREYRLVKVLADGSVELAQLQQAEKERAVLVKPMPKNLKPNTPAPTIVVEVSDFKKQTATIKLLRLQSE
jgi:hypothetical protein